ncbi:Papain family cysteine protease [compost metagenome]
MTPSQQAAIDIAWQSTLSDAYAQKHQRGLGATLTKVTPIVEREAQRATLAALPAKVDLRPACPPVYNQGPFRTCTGFAVAKGLGEYLLRRRGDTTPLSANHLYASGILAPSTAQFRRSGSTGYAEFGQFTDTGVAIAAAMAAFEMGGAVAEPDFPYPPQNLWQSYWRSSIRSSASVVDPQADRGLEPFFLVGPVAHDEGAIRYRNTATALRIRRAARLGSLDAMRASLAKGMPIVCAFSVHESFYSEAVKATGNVPLPGPGDRLIDGHAMLCVGYDDQRRVLIFRNSWGQDWGDRGYGYVPYEAIARQMLRDCWTVEQE